MSVLRVAILDDYQEAALESANWSAVAQRVAAIDVYTDTISNEDLLVKRLGDYEIICAMRERTKFPASILDRLPKLRLLTTTGMRNFAIDTEHAKSKDITLILATMRHIVTEDANIKAKNPQWQTLVPAGLSGKTIGLIGLGRLGSQTARIAKAFNMKVIAWSPNLTEERASEAGVGFASTKAELLQQSDVVSLHIVLSERTRHIITASDLALLKRQAYLINSSRGPLIDESALLAVLKAKAIAGAGLDVYDQEPLPLNHPLRELDNVTLSPHNGYVNDSSYKDFWEQTVDNIVSFLDGQPKRKIV